MFLSNTTTTIKTMTNNPSLDSIPTSNDRKEMEDTLSSLRDQLATAKQRRNEHQAKLHNSHWLKRLFHKALAVLQIQQRSIQLSRL